MKTRRHLSRLSRRRLSVISFGLLLSSLVLLGFTVNSSEASGNAQDRKYKVKTFKGMPVTVEEVRNLQKEKDWFRDLEIVIKNISGKPIYYMSFSLIFPDVPPSADAPAGAKVAFPFRFGNRRLRDLRNLAGPGDVSIKPGETYVFTVYKGFAEGFENMHRKKNLSREATKNFYFRFDNFSFGDGTGFVGGGLNGLKDYRGKTSSNKKNDDPISPRRPESSREWLLLAIDWKDTGWVKSSATGCAAAPRRASVPRAPLP
ncbi:MAG TPA: hypothetical protein VN256_03055 [Pyrinomonadaceae bacterium]|nr:hypothetical protein [Pyrinomonadaceae bacterium]